MQSLPSLPFPNIYPLRTPGKGVGLFASRDIGAGQLILHINELFVSVPDTPHLDKTCSTCFLWLSGDQSENGTSVEGRNNVSRLKACMGCKVTKYCSKVSSSVLNDEPMDLVYTNQSIQHFFNVRSLDEILYGYQRDPGQHFLLFIRDL